VIVRKARARDVEILGKLFEQFSGWHLERSVSIQKAIADSDGELLVAEVDGLVIGFVHQVFFEDPHHAGLNSLITDLFVRKEQQGQGIGSELIKRALESAKKKNVKEVHVTTREDNHEVLPETRVQQSRHTIRIESLLTGSQKLFFSETCIS